MDSTYIQRAEILNYLLKHGSLSSTFAREGLNSYHPNARIYELRQQGYDIKTTWQVVTDNQGREHRVGVWVLVGLPTKKEG